MYVGVWSLWKSDSGESEEPIVKSEDIIEGRGFIKGGEE
jgi:hypothetical protein